MFWFLLLASCSRLNAIQIGFIRNVSLVAPVSMSNLTQNIMNNTCDECICLMIKSSTSILSLNCFPDNATCQLFSNYSMIESYRLIEENNDTRLFYFLQLPPDNSSTTTVKQQYTSLIENEWTTTFLQTTDTITIQEVFSQTSSMRPVWLTVGSMSTARVYHTSTWISQNESVLIMGGSTSNNLASTPLVSMEKYNSDHFQSAGHMSIAKMAHTADQIPNSTSILIAGGLQAGDIPQSSAYLFDPTFAAAPASIIAMQSARAFHTSTVLDPPKILLIGGLITNNTVTNTSELWTGSSFTAVSMTMSMPRVGHTATRLGNNSNLVLITGGYAVKGKNPTNSVELYNASSDTFISLPITMSAARLGHTATYLPSVNKVLIAGGQSNASTVLLSAELFDVVNMSFSSPVNMLTGHMLHTATLLNNGSVLIVSGYSSVGQTSSVCELYNPILNSFTITVPLNISRSYHTATLLNTGEVLVCGGLNLLGTTISSCELYFP